MPGRPLLVAEAVHVVVERAEIFGDERHRGERRPHRVEEALAGPVDPSPSERVVGIAGTSQYALIARKWSIRTMSQSSSARRRREIHHEYPSAAITSHRYSGLRQS